MDNVRAGMHETGHKHLVDEELLAFLNGEGHTDPIGNSSDWLGRDFQ